MRAAAQQRAIVGSSSGSASGFDFPDAMMNYRQYYQQQQHVLHPPEAYLTPSPESPGQWSSASPHSTSDWSEGMSSPPNPNMGGSFAPPSHAKHTEGIYI